MNFYYDPILGLKWTGKFPNLVLLDIECISDDVFKNWKQALKTVDEMGILFIDPNKDKLPMRSLRTITEIII
jgi:hypothetical protein